MGRVLLVNKMIYFPLKFSKLLHNFDWNRKQCNYLKIAIGIKPWRVKMIVWKNYILYPFQSGSWSINILYSCKETGAKNTWALVALRLAPACLPPTLHFFESMAKKLTSFKLMQTYLISQPFCNRLNVIFLKMDASELLKYIVFAYLGCYRI